MGVSLANARFSESRYALRKRKFAQFDYRICNGRCDAATAVALPVEQHPENHFVWALPMSATDILRLPMG